MIDIKDLYAIHDECAKRKENEDSFGKMGNCETCPYYDSREEAEKGDYCIPSNFLDSTFPVYWDLKGLEEYLNSKKEEEDGQSN